MEGKKRNNKDKLKQEKKHTKRPESRSSLKPSPSNKQFNDQKHGLERVYNFLVLWEEYSEFQWILIDWTVIQWKFEIEDDWLWRSRDWQTDDAFKNWVLFKIDKDYWSCSSTSQKKKWIFYSIAKLE